MISVHLAYTATQAYRACVSSIRPGAHVVVQVCAPARPAPPLRPVPLARDLTAPLSDGVPTRNATLAWTEAERGFSAGTFFLPGQIVDRQA